MRLDSFLGKTVISLWKQLDLSHIDELFSMYIQALPLSVFFLDNLLSRQACCCDFTEKTVCFFNDKSRTSDGTIGISFQNGLPTCFVFSITCSISFSNGILAGNRKFPRKNWRRCRKRKPTGTAGADDRFVTPAIIEPENARRLCLPVLFSGCACLTMSCEGANITLSVHCHPILPAVLPGCPVPSVKPSIGLFSPWFPCKKTSPCQEKVLVPACFRRILFCNEFVLPGIFFRPVSRCYSYCIEFKHITFADKNKKFPKR